MIYETSCNFQRQIITCSGGGNSGSINIVRNGADFQELASIPGLAGATNIWGVRDQFQDTFVAVFSDAVDVILIFLT